MLKREILYLVSYDISSDKTRKKVSDELLNFGKRVQYSVFECTLDAVRFKKMYARLLKLCTDGDDSIRIYAICADCSKRTVIIGNDERSTGNKKIIIV